MELKELLQQFVNMEHAERVELGRQSMAALLNDLKSHGIPSEKATEFVHLVVCVALSADRVTAAEEYRLFSDITGANLSYDEFYQITDISDLDGAIEQLDQLVDSMSEEGKNAALSLTLCFLASDDKITPEETRLFVKLVA